MNTKQYRITGWLLTVNLFGASAAQAGDCWVDIYDKPALEAPVSMSKAPSSYPT